MCLCVFVQISDLQDDNEESQRNIQQLKKKTQRLTAELQDTKLHLEGQQSRNHDLEKKQRKSVNTRTHIRVMLEQMFVTFHTGNTFSAGLHINQWCCCSNSGSYKEKPRLCSRLFIALCCALGTDESSAHLFRCWTCVCVYLSEGPAQNSCISLNKYACCCAVVKTDIVASLWLAQHILKDKIEKLFT